MRSELTSRESDWITIKGKVNNDGLKLDYKKLKNAFKVFVIEGNTIFFLELFAPSHRRVIGESATNAADYQDFIDNYKATVDASPPSVTDYVKLANVATEGNKLTIHESSRPLKDGKSFTTVWSGSGDDMTTPAIGGGPLLAISTTVGQSTTSVEAEFHPSFGETWIHEGYLMWQNAGWGDCVSNSVFARPNVMQTATTLDYELDGTKVKIAAGGPGTGTHGFTATPILVPSIDNTGYWDFAGTLSSNATQTGAFDIYTVEVEVNRFHNKIPVFGSSQAYNMLQSADSALVPSGYFVRITAHNNSDTAWKAWCIMTLYREQTI